MTVMDALLFCCEIFQKILALSIIYIYIVKINIRIIYEPSTSFPIVQEGRIAHVSIKSSRNFYLLRQQWAQASYCYYQAGKLLLSVRHTNMTKNKLFENNQFNLFVSWIKAKCIAEWKRWMKVLRLFSLAAF